jgi:hypothetical protein
MREFGESAVSIQTSQRWRTLKNCQFAQLVRLSVLLSLSGLMFACASGRHSIPSRFRLEGGTMVLRIPAGAVEIGEDTTRQHGMPGPFRGGAFSLMSCSRAGVLANAQLQVHSGDLRGLRVEKTYSTAANARTFTLNLTLTNQSSSALTLGYRSHNLLFPDPQRTALLRIPTTRGIMRRIDNVDYLVTDLAAGWIAGIDPATHSGLVCMFDPSEVTGAFSWVGDRPTAEWIYRDASLQPGESKAMTISYLPFTGLSDVNIAQPNLLAHLQIHRQPRRQVILDVYGVRDTIVTVEPTLQDSAGNERNRLEARRVRLHQGKVTREAWNLPAYANDVESVAMLIDGRPSVRPGIPISPRYAQQTIDPVPLSNAFRTYAVSSLLAFEAKCVVPSDAAAWKGRRQELLADLNRIMGEDLPRQWPALSPCVERMVQREHHRIEAVSAEFWPGVRYAMHVYVPHGDGPFPAVLLLTTGPQGGRTPFYQNVLAGLARVGILAVGVTPIGKGVRYTANDAYGFNEIALLAGTSIRQEQHHTAMRALAYLRTRADVDPARICVTGASDGGLTALLAGILDPDVAAVAPACINSTFSKWMLPGAWVNLADEETAAPGLLRYGGNNPMLAALVAPRPLCLLNAARERDLLDQIPLFDLNAQQAYRHSGTTGNYQTRLADAEHGYWPEIAAQFIPWVYELFNGHALAHTVKAGPKITNSPFSQQLLIDDIPVDVVKSDDRAFADLAIAGLPEDGGAQAFLRIIDERLQAAKTHRSELEQSGQLRSKLEHSLGLDSLKCSPQVIASASSVQIQTEPGIVVCGDWIHPGKDRRVTLVVGETADREKLPAGSSPRLDLQMREELSLGPDLSLLVLLNRPPLGMWVWDCMSTARWLRQQGYETVNVVGVGEAGSVIAILAGLLSDDIASVHTEGSIPSFASIAASHPRQFRYWADRLLWVVDPSEATPKARPVEQAAPTGHDQKSISK